MDKECYECIDEYSELRMHASDGQRVNEGMHQVNTVSCV